MKMQFLKFEQKHEKEWAQKVQELKVGSEKCVKAILWGKINKRLFLKNNFFVKSLKKSMKTTDFKILCNFL